jgi:hypothetical protein
MTACPTRRISIVAVAGARAVVLIAFLALAGCSSAPPPGGGDFTQVLSLRARQATNLRDGSRLVFRNVVNDSRCARGAECVWAGTATARFGIVASPEAGGADGSPAGAADTLDVLAVIAGGASRPEEAALLPVEQGRWQVTLLELLPYPEAAPGSGLTTGKAGSAGTADLSTRALVRIRHLPAR